MRIETSSIDTGSSATISSGSITSAPGDHDALPLAAGQLVRVAARELRRRAQARGLERGGDPARRAPRATSPMLLTISGSATNSPIVCFGFSVSYGSWKISWTRRR